MGSVGSFNFSILDGVSENTFEDFLDDSDFGGSPQCLGSKDADVFDTAKG